jgi:PAS domain S-box-containing protein
MRDLAVSPGLTPHKRLQWLWTRYADAPARSRYTVAGAIALLAATMRLGFDPLWGMNFPMVFFYPATLFVALLGGLGPGLVSVGFFAVVAAIFIEPVSTLPRFIGVVCYAIMDCTVAWIGAEHRKVWKVVTQQAEELRKREAEALRASELQLQRLMNANIIGIMVADLDRIIDANDIFLRMAGHDRSDLEAGRLEWPATTPPDYALFDAQRLEEIRTFGACRPFEKEYFRKDGSRVPVLIGAALLSHSPLTWICFVLDLTDRKQAEDALRYLNERLEQRVRERTAALEAEGAKRVEAEARLRQAQKMEAIGQLTGGIAHDFNNLLTIIIGNLDAIERRLGSAREHHEGDAAALAATLQRPIDGALRGAGRAAELTHRLLAFGRRQPLEPKILDINKMVPGLAEMMRRTLGETIEVETVLGGGLWRVFVDLNQLENVLLNLVLNARDAMPNGGKLTIETANICLDEAYTAKMGPFEEAVPPGQYVMLSIADTGVGMPAEILDKVFEPFFTTKEVGKGTGLGLAMAYGFVRQSGGHVRIYSELGQGTTVKIYLPRRTSEPSTEASSSPAMLGAMARARSGETVLLVEDNEDVRQYAVAALEDLGYRVLEAGDAAAALHLLEAGPDRRIDLLLTDVVLPGGMNGRVLAEEVLDRRPGLPVLFTTGYSRNAIIHHGRLDPDIQLLGKPFTPVALARKVREVLDAAPSYSGTYVDPLHLAKS